jgi:hypothetical protein
MFFLNFRLTGIRAVFLDDFPGSPLEQTRENGSRCNAYHGSSQLIKEMYAQGLARRKVRFL